MRLAIMGGTLNPIHYGHLVAAEEALNIFPLDSIVFMPAGKPPHKGPQGIIAAEDRYLMAVIATASNPDFSVSRYEIDKEGPSYTVDTMRHYAGMYPDAELYFITGADAVLELDTWHMPAEIFSFGKIIAVTRPGYPLELPAEIHGFKTSQDRADKDADILLMETPGVAISSTEIRERIMAGKTVKYLLPDLVLSYIVERELYRS